MARDETDRRRLQRLLEPFRVTDGKGFRLKQVDPRDTRGLTKDEAQEHLKRGIAQLADMQDKLYAQDQWGVLLVFQAMDAAGKDGAIKHVMSGINPQGCQVYSFKAPSPEELDHDYLWRTSRCLPERGRIGIFNRSYYEEVLVVRVHPELLARQKLPPKLTGEDVWEERFQDIRSFERYLARNGYVIVKFFLHVSKEAQKERFLERLERPEKNWKFSLADAKERGYWKAYARAYEDAIRATAAEHAPWYVVPADRKWFARLVVAGAIYEALAGLGLAYPKVDAEKKKDLTAARAALLAEDKDREDRPGGLTAPTRRRSLAKAMTMMRRIARLAAGLYMLSSPAPSARADDWSFSASAYAYFVPTDRNYVSPTVTADRRGLHLEGRYNYENLDTGSVFLGRNFHVGRKLTLDATAMVGGVFGKTAGIAPGYEFSLSFGRFELSNDGEYVFDLEDSAGSFFYVWAELTYAPREWLSVGLVAQRTRAYQTSLDLQRGLLVGFIYRKLSLTAYVFNLGWTSPTFVFSVSRSF